MARSAKYLLVMGLLLLVASMRIPVLHAQEAPPSRAPDVSTPSGSGDVAGLVEVGDGRRLWLEWCAARASIDGQKSDPGQWLGKDCSVLGRPAIRAMTAYGGPVIDDSSSGAVREGADRYGVGVSGIDPNLSPAPALTSTVRLWLPSDPHAGDSRTVAILSVLRNQRSLYGPHPL